MVRKLGGGEPENKDDGVDTKTKPYPNENVSIMVRKLGNETAKKR
jgi:hypothetical protein